MPPSAIAIAKSMRAHLLPLEETKGPKKDDEAIDDDAFLYDSRWTFVETDLGNLLVDDASTLLVSVHACGTLSDYLIQMAISVKASLSLVPCCHTYSARKGYTPHPAFSGTTAEAVRTKIEDLQKQQEGSAGKIQKRSSKTHQQFQIVEDVIDEVRWMTLRNAGYGNVRIASLPQEFTERNRLFLAHEQNSTDRSVLESSMEIPRTSEKSVRKSIRKGSMPPPVDKKGSTIDALQPPSFSVPIRDDPNSIEECLSVSGKAKAIERLRKLLPNHFAPKLDVSMWLSPPLQDTTTNDATSKTTTNVTLEALQHVLDQVVLTYRQEQGLSKIDKRFRCTISPINQVFVHPENGRTACTYQIEYSYESSTIQESGEPFPKQVAKELHKSFCDRVVRCIDGTEIR